MAVFSKYFFHSPLTYSGVNRCYAISIPYDKASSEVFVLHVSHAGQAIKPSKPASKVTFGAPRELTPPIKSETPPPLTSQPFKRSELKVFFPFLCLFMMCPALSMSLLFLPKYFSTVLLASSFQFFFLNFVIA